MANHKSALKRAKQNDRIRARNRSGVADLRTSIKKVREAAAKKDAEAAKTALRDATATIDKAASKGLIHKATASRKVSRLSKLVGGLAAG